MELSGRNARPSSGGQPALRWPRRRRGRDLSLGSLPPEPPSHGDRLRGPQDAPPVIFYADLECPDCGVAWARLKDAPVNLGLRHFPVTSAHSRAFELACAAEAADAQGRFWEMVGSILEDQARIDDPHLWERAESLGLDIEAFDLHRRSEETADRVRDGFRSAVRAGVPSTPCFLFEGQVLTGVPDPATVDSWRA